MTPPCDTCEYFDKWVGVCMDPVYFVNKEDGEPICRHEENAVAWEEYIGERPNI